VILQAVSGYVCYNGDRNLSCITMSIRLAEVLLCSFRDLTCRLGSQLKINFEVMNFWLVRMKNIFVY